MNITEAALKNRLLVKFIVWALVVGGVLSFFRMGKMEDPELIVRQAQVVTIYPGASAYEVELQVTDPLEKAIRSMTGIGSVESKSSNDLSIIQVTLDVTLPEKEIQQHWDLLRRKVGDAAPSLPAEARAPVVMDDFGDVYGLFYVVTADGFSDELFNGYVEKIRQELQTVEGVGKVALYGQRQPCVYIDIRQDRLAAPGVHFYELLLAIGNQNRMVYPGYFHSGDHRIRLDVTDPYRRIEDIENLLVAGHEDEPLRLKDLATVGRGVVEPSRSSMRYDGRPAIGLAVSMAPGFDITRVGRRTEAQLQRMANDGSLPLGIDAHKVFFQSDRVDDAIATFLVNLLESVLIVVVVLMLSMGFRSGVILGSNLLVIVLTSFLALYLFDGTLQRVSLGALILAMGMLVDNAIVIIDGILIDAQRGMAKPHALTHTATKTALPLLGATLIAVLAFFPIFLSPDMAGVYVRDLFIVLAVSLLVSWLLSLTLVPLQAGGFLKIKSPPAGDGAAAAALFDGKFYTAFRRMLYFMLAHRTATLTVVAVLLVLTVVGFRFVRQGFFPDFKYEQAYIEYRMPEGTRIEQVQADLQDIERRLLGREEIAHVTSSYGGTPFRYNLVRSFAEPSLSYGELIVDFASPEAMAAALPVLQQELSDAYPQAYVRIKQYNLMYKPWPVEVLFAGPDPAVLKQLAARAEAIMEAEPSAMLVTNDWPPASPVLAVDYDQPSARRAGVARADVALSLLAATDGLPVGAYYNGRVAEPMYLRSVDARGEPVEDLSHIPVVAALPSASALDKTTLAGWLTGAADLSMVIAGLLQPPLLAQVSDGVALRWDDPVVRRHNGQRCIRAQCNNRFGFTAKQTRAAIRPAIEQLPLPQGYTMEWRGEAQASAESTRYLFANVPLAIVLMVAVLILLFKDAKKPAIIFLCIPLAAIGVVGGLLASGQEFGFVAIVGALGLIGMMIKNGVVLLDEITRLTAAGTPPVEALLTASSSRLRPVVMASGTTVLGMIPLLNDVLFGALAVTIMGGLLVGTVITLLIIPVLYALFFKINVKHYKTTNDA
jgi:multidrug efflux pump subunit AcrB